MEQRSVQPTTSPQPPLAAQPKKRGATSDTLMRWFNHLLETRPMAFWGGIWVSVFLIAIVATGSLLSPNAAERRSVSAIAIGSDSVVATQPIDSRGKVPFWLFGAIALTCGAGSILVSRQLNATSPLNQPPASRRSKRATKRRVAPATYSQPLAETRTVTAVTTGNGKRVAKPHPLAKRGLPKQRHQPKRLKPYSPNEPLFPAAGFAHPPVASAPNAQHRKQTPLPPPVTAIVVPANQVHPLDWDGARLADSFDLRRQKPIKSWL